jgi:tetratricopeptide (TPR) repeat protein
MAALGRRARSARTTMWGTLWRIEALLEGGRLATAAEELAPLRVAVERVGGPVSAWHLDRVTACVAQAQGRYAEAARAGRRGFERMRPVEPGPARGTLFSLQCVLAAHVGVGEDAAPFVEQPFVPLPLFRVVGRLARAFLLLQAGRPEEAAASYQQAGPLDGWSLPPFAVPLGYVYGVLVTAELGRDDDLAALLDRLEPFRGEHATIQGVAYLGPVDLGRAAAALGRLDAAVDDLTAAADQADRAGAPGFAAEARFHLAA